MFDLILQVVWFMLPAYIANMVPVFFSYVSFGRVLDGPVDLGRRLFGRRIFGDHKTFKGFLVGVSFGVLMSVVQHYFIGEYSLSFACVLGFLLGFGALVGDSVKSFFKRQLGVREGASLPVFDQIDFPIGALVFASIVIRFDWQVVILIIVVSGLLSFLADVVGYLLGIKKVWW